MPTDEELDRFLRGQEQPTADQVAEWPELTHLLQALRTRAQQTRQSSELSESAERTDSAFAAVCTILADAIDTTEDFVRRALQPAMPWIQPAVLGLGNAEAVDLSRAVGIGVTRCRLEGPPLTWRSQHEWVAEAPDVQVILLAAGADQLFEPPTVTFDAGYWTVSPPQVGQQSAFDDQWLLYAATTNPNNDPLPDTSTEYCLLQFKSDRRPVRERQDIWQLARDGFIAEAADLWMKTVASDRQRCAFALQCVGLQQRLLREALPDSTGSWPEHLSGIAPGSLFRKQFSRQSDDLLAYLAVERP